MKKIIQPLALATFMALFVAGPALSPLHSAAQRSSASDADATLQQFWSPSTATQVWGNSGSFMLPVAAQIMASRNPPGQALTAHQKKYLRPMFGNLVDRVRVNYNAKLADRWSSGAREIHIGAVDSAAQAFCDRIYLRAHYQPYDTAQLVLLAHELTHFQQCLKLGGLHSFGYKYFKAYQQANQKYADNQFEREARTNEQQFISALCQQINCRNPRGKYYINYRESNVKLPITIDE